MKESTWSEYYEITKDKPPTRLLVEALKYVNETGGIALELGAGSPRDSKFLIEKGFEVIAVDKTSESKDLFGELVKNNKLQFVQSSFSDFNFSDYNYDFVSAQRALPFIETKSELIRVLNRMKEGLKRDGVFASHFFGIKDTWCLEEKPMSFVDKDELVRLLDGFEIKKFEESEEDSTTANGTPHHWHVFEIIAVKK